jgi:hypothetical protein
VCVVVLIEDCSISCVLMRESFLMIYSCDDQHPIVAINNSRNEVR